MNSKQVIVLGGLAAWLAVAGPGFAQEAGPAPGPGASAGKQNSVGEMREWLSRRNLERKNLGLPGAGTVKSPASTSHAAAARPRLRRPEPPPPEESAADFQAGPPRGTPVLHIGQGPDGRIHHRLIIKEDGPDQLQVYTPSGYAAAPAEDPARLERLTPRGKRAWMAGSSLRVPAPRWLKPSLDPKARDEAQ